MNRIFVCFLIFLVIGCNEEEKPKPRYQPKDDINREQAYHFQQANMHLKEIKKMHRDSHWHLADFWQHVEAGGFELDSFKTNAEELEEWKLASFKLAATSDLQDLRQGTFDGNHAQVVANIAKYATECNLSLADFGTTEAELQDLLVSNIKNQARRILADLRQRREAETLDKIDVYDYTSKIRSLSDQAELSLEIFGTDEYELQELEYIGIGE